jgi:molybdate transport system regulatory protein
MRSRTRAEREVRYSNQLRLLLGSEVAIGPGKADLLEAIDADGSIAAAARKLGMSYMRAWSLVRTMNACFASPLVESVRGGSVRGGAKLSRRGRAVLRVYREMEEASRKATAAGVRALKRHLG